MNSSHRHFGGRIGIRQHRSAKLLRSEDANPGLLHGQRLLLPRIAHVRLAKALLLRRDLLEGGLVTTCSSTASGARNCPGSFADYRVHFSETKKSLTQGPSLLMHLAAGREPIS